MARIPLALALSEVFKVARQIVKLPDLDVRTLANRLQWKPFTGEREAGERALIEYVEACRDTMADLLARVEVLERSFTDGEPKE